MTTLPSLKAEEVIRALEKAGFYVVRVRGSHHILRHRTDPSRSTVVPVHAGKDIKRRLLRKIIGDVGCSLPNSPQLGSLASGATPFVSAGAGVRATFIIMARKL
jgi:predicted RNA binding protein YcfA (HicA-like mRNA interferase family)